MWCASHVRRRYRTQFFLWTVLGAPLILGNDIRNMCALAMPSLLLLLLLLVLLPLLLLLSWRS